MNQAESLPKDQTQPLVSIIIANWNGRAFLEMSLPSIFATDYPNFEVIVVDNGSNDDSVAYMTENFEVRVIVNARNLGFAGGSNVGLKAAQGQICVLLNNDVTVPPAWLSALVKAMMADPSVGIAGCKILDPDGITLQHAGGKLLRPLAYSYHYGAQEKDQGQFDEGREVEYVTGAAFGLKTELLKTIGLLDSDFFPGYYEEIDYCLRARQQGFRTIYVPQAVVTHHESATFNRVAGLRRYAFHKNRLRFVLKHFPPSSFFEEFIPAEVERVQGLESAEEIQASRRAYQNTLLILPEMLRLREQSQRLIDYQSAIETLETAISSRRALVYEFQADSWPREELIANHALSEPAFKSDRPLVGPLIVAFREAWNNIATKWYVRPVLQQQTTFNRLVGQSLDEQARLLHGLNELEKGASSELMAVIQHVLTMHDRFEHLTQEVQQELAELRQRLDRLEKTLERHQNENQ